MKAIYESESFNQEWALTPKPGFIYRTIGGILDMYFFLGPSPSESASQYAQAVGEYEYSDDSHGLLHGLSAMCLTDDWQCK